MKATEAAPFDGSNSAENKVNYSKLLDEAVNQSAGDPAVPDMVRIEAAWARPGARLLPRSDESGTEPKNRIQDRDKAQEIHALETEMNRLTRMQLEKPENAGRFEDDIMSAARRANKLHDADRQEAAARAERVAEATANIQSALQKSEASPKADTVRSQGITMLDTERPTRDSSVNPFDPDGTRAGINPFTSAPTRGGGVRGAIRGAFSRLRGKR